MKKLPLRQRLLDQAQRAQAFGRSYTDGFDGGELRRLLSEETARAYTSLSGNDPRAEPEDFFTALPGRLRAFLTGLAFKLSPARRLLFSLALLIPLLGFFDLDITLGPTRIIIDSSPLWFLCSISGLTLLLALELVDRVRVRDELEVARQLQRELLPVGPPLMPGWQLCHSYCTAAEIGGDYYDFIPLSDGRMVIAVGDASGHGISAGLVMAITSATLRTAVDLDPQPTAVLEMLDRVLCRTGGRRAFMTLFYSVLDPRTGELYFGCAGHPFPVLRRADGRLQELGKGALPLGMKRGVERLGERAELCPGDSLVIYSDGLPEGLGGANDDSFGFDRLHQQVGFGGPAELLHDRLLAAATKHRGQRQQDDDLTLVVMTRNDDSIPPPPPLP